MRILNPNYQPGTPAAITPARWTAILTAAQTFMANHPDLPSIDASKVIALIPELADPDVFQQFLRALNLSVTA
jgi:hypothetical protein